MNIFDIIVVQPIFNALLFIYGILPGHDFGLSIIIFTVLIRLALWPLIKKQLHQTKLMRKIQPELKKIKARTKGDRQTEAKLMMELYRERGIKPFSSIGVLLIQLPIFIALFLVITDITRNADQISQHVYGAIGQLDAVAELIKNPTINESFFGILDLTKTAFDGGVPQIPLIILALLAAGFQFIQTKQLTPQAGSQKKLRDIFKESAGGKQVDQSEMTAVLTSRMVLFMPLLLLVFALYLPAAVVLYYAATSLVAVIQQHILLNRDEEEMVALADEVTPADSTKSLSSKTEKRRKKAKKAKLTSKKSRKKR